MNERGMADTEGFEPSVPVARYDGLANRWFQPLTHVSGAWLPGAIARRRGGCNRSQAAIASSAGRGIDSLRRAGVAARAQRDSNGPKPSCGACQGG